MEKLTANKKLTVVKQYLSGQSYDEIAAKRGVSKGTVANVVADLKAGRFPEAADVIEHIEMLRELSLELRRSGLSLGHSAIGLTILSRINDCGLDPADIDRWPLVLKSVENADDARELVRLIYSIQEVRERTGLNLEDLDDKVHKLEKRAADLEPMSGKLQDYKKQLVELTGQRESLTREVAGLEEKHKLLNPLVNDLEKRQQDLSVRVKNMETRSEKAETMLATLDKEKKSLKEIGLSLEELGEFNKRIEPVARLHNITSTELRDRLLRELENLEQGLSLETLIQDRQLELEEKEKAVTLARQEQESLEAANNSLKQERKNLEASIKETREKLSKEMAKIVPAARATINSVVKELQSGHGKVLDEVRRLRDEALEVGREVGRFEEMLQANLWLRELLTLVRGEEGIEGKRVRAIVLKVLRSAEPWLKDNEANKWGFSTLTLATESLIKEMEKWKA